MLLKIQNKLDYLKKYLDWQILLIIFVNLFLANLVPHIFFPTLLWCFAGFLGKELSEYDSLICYILLGFILLRLYWLPVMYNICEHKLKNEIMQEFIYKLKNNNKFRRKFLFCIELPLLMFMLGSILYEIFITWDEIKPLMHLSWIFDIVTLHFIFLLISIIFFDLFGSYLVLFLWWKIRGELK